MLDADEFKQNGINGPIYPTKHPNEINLDAIETLGPEFFKIIEPGILAFEEYLTQEFGKDVTFDCVVLDRKSILQQIRILDASEDSDPKVELWTVTDSQRSGSFQVTC